MIVAVLNLLVGAVIWFAFGKVIDEASGVAGVDQNAIATLKLIRVIPLVVAAIYFGLFFWAKTNPFAACLTALIIYLTSIVVNLALNPMMFASPLAIVMAVAIILALASGVRSGLAYSKLKKGR